MGRTSDFSLSIFYLCLFVNHQQEGVKQVSDRRMARNVQWGLEACFTKKLISFIMQIGGGGRGMVEEGKGATFTDAKGFAVPSHPPWISHCLADHVSMSLFFSLPDHSTGGKRSSRLPNLCVCHNCCYPWRHVVDHCISAKEETPEEVWLTERVTDHCKCACAVGHFWAAKPLTFKTKPVTVLSTELIT